LPRETYLDRNNAAPAPPGSVSYAYDAAGRRTSMSVSGQTAVNYTFDNANRLTQISQGSANVSFGYDNDSRRTSLTLPNGVALNYGYDAASQLTGINYTLGTNTLGNLTYAYDLAGRRTGVSGSYARTGTPQAASSATYNVNNQLTQWKGASLTYDANGNLTSDGTNTYTWNARNQLVAISGGASASFQYDPFGRRVSKTIGGQTQYLYDGANPVQEISGTTASANLLTGGVDEYFLRTDSAGARNFLTDALGSTLALADSTGTLQTQYTFEPFGNTQVTGTATTNSFAYTGRELDATGLYFYRARYYNPALQRFISEDPIGFNDGDSNLYAYTRNSPTNHTDASGKIIDLNALGDAVGNFALNHANYIPAVCSADSFRFYGGGLGDSKDNNAGAYRLNDVHYSNGPDGWHPDGLENDLLFEGGSKRFGGGGVTDMSGRKPKEALFFLPLLPAGRKIPGLPLDLHGDLGLLLGYIAAMDLQWASTETV
jgi:RHS repeat-associated protein